MKAEVKVVNALRPRFPRAIAIWCVLRGWSVVYRANVKIMGWGILFGSPSEVLETPVLVVQSAFEFQSDAEPPDDDDDDEDSLGDNWEQWERQFDQP